MVQQALGMIIENVFKDGQKKILIKTQTLHTENSANLSTNINDTNLNTTFQKTENSPHFRGRICFVCSRVRQNAGDPENAAFWRAQLRWVADDSRAWNESPDEPEETGF